MTRAPTSPVSIVSAFVSAAWGLANHFTTAAIPAITREVTNAWDMQPGDAFNKAGSHVMLFMGFTPDRKAQVMESSTGGCQGRVCSNVYPLASLLARGYKPVRFRALENDQVAQAAIPATTPDTKNPDGAKAEAHKAECTVPRRTRVRPRTGRRGTTAGTDEKRMSLMDMRFHALGTAMAGFSGVVRGGGAGARAIAATLAIGVLAGSPGASAQALRPPQGGEVRALVIGIDAYQFVPTLHGAVADARDLKATLRRNGIKDVTALFDAAADRATVMRSLDQLLERSRPGDLVILTIAGHGVQEPEHVKGSQPDGLDNVFVLAGFDPKTPAGTRQRIIGTEFNHVIREFEARGVQVMFVADACYGGGMAREIDPRAGAMTYRQAPRYSLTIDDLQPISTPADAFLSGIDFHRTAFLAAVDRRTKAPEVRIPGVPGFRGALSYAVARAMDGAADENQDGIVTQQELFNYVRQVAYGFPTSGRMW